MLIIAASVVALLGLVAIDAGWRRNDLKRFLTAGLVGAALGSLFPIAFLIAYHLRVVRTFPEWALYIWPTSIMLMAAEFCRGRIGCNIEVLVFSLGSNAVIYLVLGMAVWWAWSAREKKKLE